MPKKRTLKVEHTLRPFNWTKHVKTFSFILTLGKRRSGKSVFSRHILQHVLCAQRGQIMLLLGNESIAEEWKAIVDPTYMEILDNKDDEKAIRMLQNLIDEMNRRVKMCKDLGIPFPPELEVVLVMDDVGSSERLMKCGALKKIITDGRNLKITLILLVQRLNHACTTARENPDLVLALATLHRPTQIGVHKEMASAIEFDIFQTAWTAATRNRGMLVVKCNPKKPQVESVLAHSHVQFLHPDGWDGKLRRVGCEATWEFVKVFARPEPPIPKQRKAEKVAFETHTTKNTETKKVGKVALESKPVNEPSTSDEEEKDDEEDESDDEIDPNFDPTPFTNGLITIRCEKPILAWETNVVDSVNQEFCFALDE